MAKEFEEEEMKRTKFVCVAFLLVALVLFLFTQVKEQAADHTGPVITMESESVSVSVNDGTDAVLTGVTAQDNRDGDVTDSLLVESLGTFTAENTRLATLAAVDAAGNVTKVTRQVVYTDYTGPEFQLSSPLRLQTGSSEISSAVGATDVLDGDLSGQVKISSDTAINSGDTGDYQVTFSVKNSAGDTAEMTATLSLYSTNDRTIPTITLSDYLIYIQAGQKIDPWDYVTGVTVGSIEWTRGTLGNLRAQGSDEIITEGDFYISNGVSSSTPGCYEISYSYTADGKTGTVRLIVIVEE
jgi:hypothetical protein